MANATKHDCGFVCGAFRSVLGTSNCCSAGFFAYVNYNLFLNFSTLSHHRISKVCFIQTDTLAVSWTVLDIRRASKKFV